MADMSVRRVTAVFGPGGFIWVPEVVTVDGCDFMELKVSSELKKLIGWKARDMGLSSARAWVDMRDARNDAITKVINKREDRMDDPFLAEGARKGKKARIDIDLPPTVVVELADHPQGEMRMLTHANPRTNTFVELTEANLKYVVGQLQANVQDADFEPLARRRCTEEAPCELVRGHKHIKWRSDKQVYYYAILHNGQRVHHRCRVTESEDPVALEDYHLQAAQACLDMFNKVTEAGG